MSHPIGTKGWETFHGDPVQTNIARQLNDALNQQRVKLLEQISERSLARREQLDLDYFAKAVAPKPTRSIPPGPAQVSPDPPKPIPQPIARPRSDADREREVWEWMSRRVRS